MKLLKMLKMKLENRSNFYLINKPKTWTSQDLCSKFKYLYKFKKVGHAGTLDPNAEGLMLLATDKYTKLFNYTKETDKTYKVSTLFGYSSDSIDTDTDVNKNEDVSLNDHLEELNKSLNTFLGSSMQKPPMYSAVKVDGKRLYKYARQGKEVDIPDREIHISKFELLDIDGPKAEFLITVSKGTYIRSLILDLAVKLNTTAVVTEIFRTNIGKLSIEYPEYIRDINTLESTTEPVSIHWSKILDLPVLEIDDLIYKKIIHGELLDKSMFSHDKLTVIDYKNNIAALYTPFNKNYFKPEKVLL